MVGLATEVDGVAGEKRKSLATEDVTISPKKVKVDENEAVAPVVDDIGVDWHVQLEVCVFRLLLLLLFLVSVGVVVVERWKLPFVSPLAGAIITLQKVLVFFGVANNLPFVFCPHGQLKE